jgi:hypothetical protein
LKRDSFSFTQQGSLWRRKPSVEKAGAASSYQPGATPPLLKDDACFMTLGSVASAMGPVTAKQPPSTTSSWDLNMRLERDFGAHLFLISLILLQIT